MQPVPYDFQARFPLDHALAAIRLIRSDGYSTPELLKLVGAMTGELGALLGNGPIFSLGETPEGMTFGLAAEQLESLELSTAAADPSFDPTPWIPVILFIIELILKRRAG